MNRIIIITTLLLAVSGQASTFVLTGGLDDSARPADGVFTFDFAILDENGAELWSETQAGVIVVDGTFAVDVGAVTPIPGGIPGPSRLQVTVDGDALPAFPLTVLVRSTTSAISDLANDAETTERLAGVPAADALTRTALVTQGAVAVPFSAITGAPAGLADGDNGVDALPGAGLALASRQLSVVNPVEGSLFADGSLEPSRFAGGVPNAAIQNGAITGAKVVGTLTRSNLNANPVETSFAGRDLFVDAFGCANRSPLTIATTCAAASCTTSGGAPGFVGCDGNGCLASNPSSCRTSRVGTLVAP